LRITASRLVSSEHVKHKTYPFALQDIIMPKDNSKEKRSNRKDTPYEHGQNKGKKGRKKGSGGGDTAPVSSFDDLNLKPDLLKGIYAYGFEKPSAIQQRAIRPIVRGRDVIAQSQSGTGKTAVFSISALQLLDETSRDAQVLVLSPTRELAEQSQRVIQSLGDFMNVRSYSRSNTFALSRPFVLSHVRILI
jgi:superfamily II DNA/RNA helicase